MSVAFILVGIIFADTLSWAQTIEFLRGEARQIMRTRLCGVCHIPPGVERALKVFDLDQNNWVSKMSDNQVEQIRWRIKVKGEEVREQRGDPKKHTFTNIEIELMNTFIDTELNERKSINRIPGL